MRMRLPRLRAVHACHPRKRSGEWRSQVSCTASRVHWRLWRSRGVSAGFSQQTGISRVSHTVERNTSARFCAWTLAATTTPRHSSVPQRMLGTALQATAESWRRGRDVFWLRVVGLRRRGLGM